MEITVDMILKLRQEYLKKHKALIEIYIPRFCDDSELMANEISVYKMGSIYSVYGIKIIRDNSEFLNNFRVVYEAAEVVPFE